jgi:hypothetical protein
MEAATAGPKAPGMSSHHGPPGQDRREPGQPRQGAGEGEERGHQVVMDPPAQPACRNRGEPIRGCRCHGYHLLLDCGVHGPRVGCGRPAGSRWPPASFGVCCSVRAVALSQRPATVPGALRPRSPPPRAWPAVRGWPPTGRGSDVLADVVAHRQDAPPWVAAVADTRYWPTVLAWNVATAVPRRPGSTSYWTPEVAALTATAAPSGPVTCSPSCCQDGVALPWEGTAMVALVFPGPPRRGSASAGGVGRAGDLRGALVGHDRGAGVGDRHGELAGDHHAGEAVGPVRAFDTGSASTGRRQYVGDDVTICSAKAWRK